MTVYYYFTMIFFTETFRFLNGSAEDGTPNVDAVLREIYVLYSDCSLKDPFYELEMAIRCDLFIHAVDTLIDRAEKRPR